MNDFRCAVRSLGRTPGFTIAAAVTLALGIGAASAGFTLLNGVLLRPLPGVRDASRLGLVWIAAQLPNGGMRPSGLTESQATLIAKRAPALSDFAGRQVTEVDVGASGETPKQVGTHVVMPGYFAALGVGAERGRVLGPADDAGPDGQPVAVISRHLWQELLGNRPDVVGSTIIVDGLHFTVVGVAAAGFRGTERMEPADLWIPWNTYWSVRHFSATPRRELSAYEFVTRLKPNASFTLAEQQLKSAVHALAVSDTNHFDSRMTATVFPGLGLRALGRTQTAYPLHLIMGIAGLVLLVACANVANLLLFRRAQRRSESVVRLVLGANRRRLVRHYLVESAVLGGLGVAGGLLLLPWLQGVLDGLRIGWRPVGHVAMDWRVFAFAAAVGFVTALVAGFLPALFAARTDYSAELKDAGPTHSGGVPRLRFGLAVVQIAVSLTLVSGAYLFARTLQNYARVPLGFDPDGVSSYQVRPKDLGYTQERTRTYLAALAERVRGAPGVERVALAQALPFPGSAWRDRIRDESAPDAQTSVTVTTDHVTSNFFDVLRIPMLRGHTFDAAGIVRDSGAAIGQVVLSQALAKKLFGDADPIGRYVTFGTAEHHGEVCVVVGVTADARWETLSGSAPLLAYSPLGQAEHGPRGVYLQDLMLAVRSELPASAVAQEVNRTARALDASLPVQSEGPLSGSIAASISDRTFFFHVVGALAALTILLTAVGLYSLVAYAVASRTREFGIRIAIGASARDLMRTVARPSLIIIVVGVAAGTGGALLTTRFIKSMLFGVSPFDVAAFVTAAALLTVVVLIATYLPARRATKIDPVEALRSE